LKSITSFLVEQIEILCAVKGTSINAMLNSCGVGRNFMDNLKKGSIPAVDKLIKIADYFGVTVDYLLGKEDIEKALSSGNESALPIELKDMLMKFRILSPQAREDMIRYLGYLAQRDSQDNE
jgi:transcriptional regulator with XRE-family HTH domain